MATDLLTGLVALAIGFALVYIIRGKDGPRFLKTSSWLVVYPVLPLFFFVMGVAQLIRAFPVSSRAGELMNPS
jgi:uncharacterized membrane protein HdeD (DUF308 family)